jgi:ABC-type Na+ transport system ATPase subunit NatA
MTNEAVITRTNNPRDLLSGWANDSDEWVRYIVRLVLNDGRALGRDAEEAAYALFRQEKAFDPRTLPVEQPLVTLDSKDEAIEPLVLTALSDITGVNALVDGASIEPHEGLTILFGENGTGKTGYSRIFKALAASRTADVVLGNIDTAGVYPQAATVEYRLGARSLSQQWGGETGLAPFTRMSIFDSPSVSFHVDEALEYVYTPAALALFNYVTAGIKAVQQQIENAKQDLAAGTDTLLGRFSRTASIYPLIQTLGAATELDELKAKSDASADVDDRIATLGRTVAALEADTISSEIKVQQRTERVLSQAVELAQRIGDFNAKKYRSTIASLARHESDYVSFRAALFDAADLPADPDDTWNTFVSAGDTYRQHLVGEGVHDSDRCLYCRQPLEESARELLSKYAELLEDKIASDITADRASLRAASAPISSAEFSEVVAYVADQEPGQDEPDFFSTLQDVVTAHGSLLDSLVGGSEVSDDVPTIATLQAATLADALREASEALTALREQSASRNETLGSKKLELAELKSAAELAKSWPIIEQRVKDAKQADRLQLAGKPITGLLRAVTALSKAASDELVNRSFESLFEQERHALRAPKLKLEFVGRDGRAKRQKVISGKHKPSKVFSEGEQKVLAIADFLAEAQLAGITAPVIFDDPVSSLDHRRVREVAERITALAETVQVIVFTHDILFATTLLHLMESSKRCSYFQITDDGGKGQIAKASGPRWDTTKAIKGKIHTAIQDAKTQTGDARAALIITGYNLIRAWCEVFIENDLLQGVTKRYQPNVMVGALERIKTGALPSAFETVNRVFEDACRYIDGHSQPLATLGVSPTLQGLEADWAKLTGAADAHNAA